MSDQRRSYARRMYQDWLLGYNRSQLVDLARINRIGSRMDAAPKTVVEVLGKMHAAGKAVIGMKILGQGDMRHRADEALKYALSLGILDAFTIGAESRAEHLDLLQRISAVPV